MNNWFNDIFLKSLFDKYGINKPQWLTQKQTEICQQNMQESIKHRGKGEGNHSNYYTTWNGRKVILFYSQVNKCGSITFCETTEESEKSKEIYKDNQQAEEINRLKRYPELLQRKISDLEETIKQENEWIQEDIKEGLSIEKAKKYIEKLQKELEMYKTIEVM
jgi:uncharacterized Zn finger protein (UPF0148 family)